MPDIGPMEIILVLAIALLVLGPSKLPEIGKSLGSSIREFRKAATDVQESVRLDGSAQQPAAGASPAQAAPAPAQASPLAAAPAQTAPAAVSAPAQPQSASSNEPQVGA
jgi:sec-independent protein translocase protein TatA